MMAKGQDWGNNQINKPQNRRWVQMLFFRLLQSAGRGAGAFFLIFFLTRYLCTEGGTKDECDDVIIMIEFHCVLVFVTGPWGGGLLTPPERAEVARWLCSIKAGWSPHFIRTSERHSEQLLHTGPTESQRKVHEFVHLSLFLHLCQTGFLYSFLLMWIFSLSLCRCRGALGFFACRSSFAQLSLRPSGWLLR